MKKNLREKVVRVESLVKSVGKTPYDETRFPSLRLCTRIYMQLPNITMLMLKDSMSVQPNH